MKAVLQLQETHEDSVSNYLPERQNYNAHCDNIIRSVKWNLNNLSHERNQCDCMHLWAWVHLLEMRFT